MLQRPPGLRLVSRQDDAGRNLLVAHTLCTQIPADLVADTTKQEAGSTANAEENQGGIQGKVPPVCALLFGGQPPRCMWLDQMPSTCGFVFRPSQPSWRRTYSGASFAAGPVQGSRSRARKRGSVPIGSGSGQRSGCARSAGRGYSRLQPPCLNPNVNGILHGVPEIRLFIVEIMLECAAVSVGVDVVV